MAVELAEFIPSLLREIQPPGSTIFDAVDSSAWVGYLADAFWEARLDGFLTGYVADEDGVITAISGEGDIDRRDIALVILYAGIRILRNRILNTKTSFSAKAGPVEYAESSSATMLVEMLRQLRDTKANIVDAADFAATGVEVLDAFSTRLFNSESYYGSLGLTG